MQKAKYNQYKGGLTSEGIFNLAQSSKKRPIQKKKKKNVF